MGVGKTTIGKRLARKLGMKFLDSDREIESRTGASISLIFDVEGESGFRERETRLIDELTSATGIVLATGGGAILSPVNRDALKQRGIVIYLSATPDLLVNRVAHDQSRPLLQTDDRMGAITSLLEAREPYYRDMADLTLPVDNLSAAQIVNRICKYMEDPKIHA